eukprot:1195220-Prorocentrum_minimum.AAC.4
MLSSESLWHPSGPPPPVLQVSNRALACTGAFAGSDQMCWGSLGLTPSHAPAFMTYARSAALMRHAPVGAKP